MGNTQSIQSENFTDENIGKYFDRITELYKQIDDNQFGQITIYKRNDILDDDQQLVFQKQKVIPNKQEYVNFYQEIDQRLMFQHPNLLKFYGYQFNCSKNICGSTNKCCLYYEYIDRTLDYEITKRHKNTEYFSEKEMWYLLSALTSISYCLQKLNISHNDIRPENVFVSIDGIIKLGDNWLLNSLNTNYKKSLIFKQKTYISPQLMKALKTQQKFPDHDKYKSDIWSLGLTILESSTLISAQNCYNWDDSAISFTSIQDLLFRASSRYSNDFVKIIKQMLEEDERKRIDFNQLFETLKQQKLQRKKNRDTNISNVSSQSTSRLVSPSSHNLTMCKSNGNLNKHYNNFMMNRQESVIIKEGDEFPCVRGDSNEPASYSTLHEISVSHQQSDLNQSYPEDDSNVYTQRKQSYTNFQEQNEALNRAISNEVSDKENINNQGFKPPNSVNNLYNQNKYSGRESYKSNSLRSSMVSNNTDNQYTLNELELKINHALQQTQQTLERGQNSMRRKFAY